MTRPYNTAYLDADRCHLYREFGVDPALDVGRFDPESGEAVAPPDYRARYRAVLSFYGRRCGRCGRRLAAPGDDRGALGHVFSVRDAAGEDAPWALEALVPLCPPCFDLVDATGPEDLGTVCTDHREAPQFPTWLCDPRVAVERAPLTGRELFYREQLEARVDADRFDFGANDPVADAAVLALDTPASVAVTFGERLVAAAHGCPEEPSPLQAWRALSTEERLVYERRTLDPDAVARGDRWRRRRSAVELPEDWEPSTERLSVDRQS